MAVARYPLLYIPHSTLVRFKSNRPHLIIIRNATDVIMQNIKTRNTPNWNIHFAWVTNLWVHHVHSVNDVGGPNADGLDIDAVQNALVEDNYFDVDDDALCVKSGRDWDGQCEGNDTSPPMPQCA